MGTVEGCDCAAGSVRALTSSAGRRRGDDEEHDGHESGESGSNHVWTNVSRVGRGIKSWRVGVVHREDGRTGGMFRKPLTETARTLDRNHTGS